MAIQSNILAWRILWTEKPGGLQSIVSHRVRDNCSDLACMHASTCVYMQICIYQICVFCLFKYWKDICNFKDKGEDHFNSYKSHLYCGH